MDSGKIEEFDTSLLDVAISQIEMRR